MSKTLTTLFILLPLLLISQEICNNATDDDNDGLIDLNDPDCICRELQPNSLIPNSSFEEQLCCPDELDELECAVSWSQASRATSDYFHRCGITYHQWIGWLPPSSSLPDGEGYIGFRDGKPNQENFKEYVGTCLNDQMVVGTEYTLSFFVGFAANQRGFDGFEVALFGTTDCQNLPFGQASTNFGCPTNGRGWELLASQDVKGNNEWIEVQLKFTALEAYEAIVIGPGCAVHPSYQSNPYFFADRLTLASSNSFDLSKLTIDGNTCEDSLTLSYNLEFDEAIQWYHNGIAILNANEENITIAVDNVNEGEYVGVIQSPSGCFTTLPYALTLPQTEFDLETFACDDDFYLIADTTINQTGMYTISLESTLGCDSILHIKHEQRSSIELEWEQTICKGDSLIINGISLIDEGFYTINATRVNGCDSIIHIELNHIDYDQLLVLETNSLDISLGEEVTITTEHTSSAFIEYEWRDPNNTIIGYETSFTFTPVVSGIYTLSAFDDQGCGTSVQLNISITTSDVVFYPNVIRLDDEKNNRFRLTTTKAISLINSLVILDRWGNVVFKEEDINFNNHQGWNGTFQGENVAQGVYVFIAELALIDGSVQKIVGDITVLQ